MSTAMIQSCYRQTPSSMFDPDSIFPQHLISSESEYLQVWRDIALKERMQISSFVGDGRRDEYLFDKLECNFNKLCKDISISGRTGKIYIALDDDKIWAFQSNDHLAETFGLKYQVHVQANRRGFVAHTAVSTGLMIPLGITFEKKSDSADICFKRILAEQFSLGRGTDPILCNVILASDRGYMLPKLVFNYLIKHGGDFIGTTKRTKECWPFTFNQKPSQNDKRKLIDLPGTACLFIKKVKEARKTIFSSAFRNGTGKVNTCVSSLHRNHHWEGTALYPHEADAYFDRDERSEWKRIRKEKEFERVDNSKLNIPLLSTIDTDHQEEHVLQHIANSVRPITLRQGTADWHFLRKLCLTSSQSHQSIMALLPEYGNNDDVKAVMRYLEGLDWAPPDEERGDGSDDNNESGEGGDGDGDGDGEGGDGEGEGDGEGGGEVGGDGGEVQSLRQYVESFNEVSLFIFL